MVDLATALSGRQQIHAVPDAQRAAVATVADSAVVADAAAEASALTCPNSTIDDYGLCIVAAETYDYTQAEGASFCRGHGMRLCSSAEVTSAWAQGFTLCSHAWVGDYISSSEGRRVLVSDGSAPGPCGNRGLNPTTASANENWGVLCCR